MTALAPTPSVQVLSTEACWELLRGTNLGRLAVAAGDGIDLFPVNYLVDGDTLVFRSAPGRKLREIATDDRVAFEVDGSDATHRWSVVLRGRAAHVEFDDEIESSGILRLATDAPIVALTYIRIVPTALTGRRFRWGGPV